MLSAHIDLLAVVERVERELVRLLPGAYYADPPDGGDVPLLEQVRRMSIDAARYRYLREQQWFNDPPFGVVVRPKRAVRLGHGHLALELLDAEVDAAMKGGAV